MQESDLKFLKLLPEEIKKHPNDLLFLRNCLISFKNQGMDKDTMLRNLEKLKAENDCQTENILLDLMDFVAGWCNPSMSVFK